MNNKEISFEKKKHCLFISVHYTQFIRDVAWLEALRNIALPLDYVKGHNAGWVTEIE
jgi:hypothetical protein